MSLLYARSAGEPRTYETFGNTHLYGLLIFELLTVPAVVVILHMRGWRLKDFPCVISKPATILGMLAYGAAFAMGWIFSVALWQLFFSGNPAMEGAAYSPAHPPSLVAVYLVSIVNPVFEEAIVCGYVLPALAARFGQTVAINVSVVIRGSYHLYQGIANLPFHLGYGLLQAYLYVRFRNLWPLIVNHALADFVPLAFFL